MLTKNKQLLECNLCILKWTFFMCFGYKKMISAGYQCSTFLHY